MTNEEKLEKRIKELENIIKEHEFLAEAVEAKNKEIAQLRESYEQEIQKIKQVHERQLTEKVKQTEELYKQNLEKLQTENKKRVNQLNRLINIHGDLLKTLLGTVNTSLTVNEYFVEEVNK